MDFGIAAEVNIVVFNIIINVPVGHQTGESQLRYLASLAFWVHIRGVTGVAKDALSVSFPYVAEHRLQKHAFHSLLVPIMAPIYHKNWQRQQRNDQEHINQVLHEPKIRSDPQSILLKWVVFHPFPRDLRIFQEPGSSLQSINFNRVFHRVSSLILNIEIVLKFFL